MILEFIYEFLVEMCLVVEWDVCAGLYASRDVGLLKFILFAGMVSFEIIV